MGLNFYLYAQCKQFLLTINNKSDNTTSNNIHINNSSGNSISSIMKIHDYQLQIEAVAGGVAGGVAKLVFYPLVRH